MSREILSKVESPEFSYEVIVADEWIDRNNHVNNARYFDIYERARGDYMETVCGVNVADFEAEYGLRAMVAGPFNGTFGGQLFPTEHLTVFSAAESSSRHIRFSQRIPRSGQPDNEFHCTVYLVDSNNAIKRIPDSLRQKITQAGFK